jgi:deoxycytidylate deaminase
MHHKLAAIITQGSWIISVGYNRWKSFDHSIHAEQDAIKQAIKILPDLDNCNLYVARWCKTKVGLARPCSKCMSLALKQGIKEIYYTVGSEHAAPHYQYIYSNEPKFQHSIL